MRRPVGTSERRAATRVAEPARPVYRRPFSRGRRVLGAFAMVACACIAFVTVTDPYAGATAEAAPSLTSANWARRLQGAALPDPGRLRARLGHARHVQGRRSPSSSSTTRPPPHRAAEAAAARPRAARASYTTPVGTAQTYAAQAVAGNGWGAEGVLLPREPLEPRVGLEHARVQPERRLRHPAGPARQQDVDRSAPTGRTTTTCRSSGASATSRARTAPRAAPGRTRTPTTGTDPPLVPRRNRPRDPRTTRRAPPLRVGPVLPGRDASRPPVERAADLGRAGAEAVRLPRLRPRHPGGPGARGRVARRRRARRDRRPRGAAALASALLADLVSGTVPIRSGTELAAVREDVELATVDGLVLVGELALPVGAPAGRDPRLPASAADGGRLHGLARAAQGRRAAARPRRPRRAALQHPRHVEPARHERGRVRRRGRRALRRRRRARVRRRARPPRAVAARLVVRHRARAEVRPRPTRSRAPCCCPRRCTARARRSSPRWHGSGKRLVVLVPELDDYLRPAEAAERFAVVPEARLVAVEGAKHLWVGENQVRRVLDEIVRGRCAPDRAPLPPTEVPARPAVATPRPAGG